MAWADLGGTIYRKKATCPETRGWVGFLKN